jgi:hypothetical protein
MENMDDGPRWNDLLLLPWDDPQDSWLRLVLEVFCQAIFYVRPSPI